MHREQIPINLGKLIKKASLLSARKNELFVSVCLQRAREQKVEEKDETAAVARWQSAKTHGRNTARVKMCKKDADEGEKPSKRHSGHPCTRDIILWQFCLHMARVARAMRQPTRTLVCMRNASRQWVDVVLLLFPYHAEASVPAIYIILIYIVSTGESSHR